MTEQVNEVAKCFFSAAYFIGTHCHIYDATDREWVPFDLWPLQEKALDVITENNLAVILKARQLGMTWLVLGYALWLMIFRPEATVLIFSKRDDEAIYLLDERLKGMFQRLPESIRYGITVIANSMHEWSLSNGSKAYAFPTTGGDSYTATLAIMDEFDLVQNQDKLLASVKPTISGGGKMIMLSRPDKSRPSSPFKNTYRAAKTKQNNYAHIFLPWSARPTRTAEWYEGQKNDILSRTGALDELHEQYPATDIEALAPRSLDKRIPPTWLIKVYQEIEPVEDAPLGLPGITVYRLPERGRGYVIGADPAEGNPTSDDSAFTVLDKGTGEEMASFANKVQPDTFASYIDLVGRYYGIESDSGRLHNRVEVMVERNNHGHAVLLWLKDNSQLIVLNGPDGKPGWLSNSQGKSTLYTKMTESCRNQAVTIHDFVTYTQLSSIEGSTLRAPEGEMDDRADSYALANAGMVAIVVYAPPKSVSYKGKR